MFGKVIVFGLFKMIQKKKVRIASSGPGLVRYHSAGRHIIFIIDKRKLSDFLVKPNLKF